jgi:hypothetical protein
MKILDFEYIIKLVRVISRDSNSFLLTYLPLLFVITTL